MVLIGVRGSSQAVTKRVISEALARSPSLLIDCTNAANPYRFDALPEQFANTFVIEAESLYRFKPTIQAIPRLARDLDTITVCITSHHHLFDFGNSREQEMIIRNCWKLLEKYKDFLTIIIGLRDDQAFAGLCDEIIEVS